MLFRHAIYLVSPHEPNLVPRWDARLEAAVVVHDIAAASVLADVGDVTAESRLTEFSVLAVAIDGIADA